MPASRMSHFDESIITGTLDMSGSDAIRFKNVTIADFESNMPSSILISMTCAPFSTCCRATASASSNSPLRINRLNIAEPVTLVRSPTFTKPVVSSAINGSSPDRRITGSFIGISRGWCLATFSAIKRMCSGVVPQQPPIMLTRPASAYSATISDISAASKSYSPN